MSSVEIEDVLSSIRRLVSEDLRPPVNRPVLAERLILTPALRVVPDPVLRPAPPMDAQTTPPDPVAAAPAVDGVDDFVWSQAEMVEVDLDAVEEAELVEEPLHLQDRWRDGPTLRPVPDAPRPDTARPEAMRPEPLRKAAEPVPDAARLADLAEAAALAEINAARPRPADPARQDPAAPELLGEEDFLIDEDVVRELVRDIIREELQGALGERITRNVRKLVRAEVNRALLARDFS